MESIRTQLQSWDEFHKQVSLSVAETMSGVEAAVSYMMPQSKSRKRTTARIPRISRASTGSEDDEEESPGNQSSKGKPLPVAKPTSRNPKTAGFVGPTNPLPPVFAKSAPCQELHFVVPQNAKPGAPVCLVGPHGDPIVVPLPPGAEPGKPSAVWLGPEKSFKVIVPDDSGPGQMINFVTENGEMLNTVVPLDKKAGDTFELCPPAMLIQVPPGALAGQQVVYIDPQGMHAMTVVPPGYKPGSYFTTLLPVPAPIAEIAMRQNSSSGSAIMGTSSRGPKKEKVIVELLDDMDEPVACETMPIDSPKTDLFEQKALSQTKDAPGLGVTLAKLPCPEKFEAISELLRTVEMNDNAVDLQAVCSTECDIDEITDTNSGCNSKKESHCEGDFRMLSLSGFEAIYNKFKIESV